MDVGVAAAQQHQILHHRPVYPTTAGTGTLRNNVVYQSFILDSFSNFGATDGRYFRPLRFPAATTSDRGLALGLGGVLALAARPCRLRVPRTIRRACRCWPIPTPIGTSPSATGSWRTAACRRSTATPSPSPASPGSPRSGCRRSLLALAFNVGGWGGVSALAAAAIGFTFALLLRLLLRDLRPLPALLFTAAAIVMTAPHFLARPHVLAFPLHAAVGRGPGARRRGAACARAVAAGGHAAVGQHAWRLHPGADAGRSASRSRPWSARAMRPSAGRSSSPGPSSASPPCSLPASRPTARNRSW